MEEILKGLFVVSLNGKILQDVKTSGDEAMLFSKFFTKSYNYCK